MRDPPLFRIQGDEERTLRTVAVCSSLSLGAIISQKQTRDDFLHF